MLRIAGNAIIIAFLRRAPFSLLARHWIGFEEAWFCPGIIGRFVTRARL
jgi:hypothetical protein